MPPKALFDNSFPPDKLVMPSCIECNKRTSTADLTVATASRWAYDNTTKEQLDHRKPAQQVKKQAPHLIAEWTKLDRDERAKVRLHLIEHGVDVPEAGMVSIGRSQSDN